MKNFPVLLAGVGVGAGITMLALPTPPEREQCSVYKVEPKTVTAYVLKPPKCEPITVTVPQACHVATPQPKEETTRKRSKRRRR